MRNYNILKIIIPLLGLLLVGSIFVANRIGKERADKKETTFPGGISREQVGKERKTTNVGEQVRTAEKAFGLREAYNLAKPEAKSRIGNDAEIFNAVSPEIRSDGKSRIWFISFCSPTKLQGIAVIITDGKIVEVLGPEPINSEENEFCEPLNSNWIDSTKIAQKTGCETAGFHIEFYPKEYPPTAGKPGVGFPPDEGIETWELICNNKFWAFDVYSGELVKQGETTKTIRLPVAR